MRVKCPRCKQAAELNASYERVQCSHCGLDTSYVEYLALMRQRLEAKLEQYQSQPYMRPDEEELR